MTLQGGKVSLEALRLLAEAREALPSQTWVLDSPPGLVPHEIESRTGVSTVLNMVHVSAMVSHWQCVCA